MFHQATATPTLAPNPASNTQTETEIFELINSERASRGLPELSSNSKLTTIARAWSSELALSQTLTHGNFTQRLEQINSYNYGYQYGEIIASRSASTEPAEQLARFLVNQWLNSQGHRDIMLTDKTGSMGVGVSRSWGTVYAVTDFQFNLD